MSTGSSDFSDINRQSAKSFHRQRSLIKDLCRGKQVNCPECNQLLSMIGPDNKKANKPPGIYCKKGCTSIELEFEG